MLGLHSREGAVHVVVRNPHNRSGTTEHDFRKLPLLGHGGLNCDHKASCVLVPACDFHKYFMTLSCFHWIVPPSSLPIHVDVEAEAKAGGL